MWQIITKTSPTYTKAVTIKEDANAACRKSCGMMRFYYEIPLIPMSLPWNTPKTGRALHSFHILQYDVFEIEEFSSVSCISLIFVHLQSLISNLSPQYIHIPPFFGFISPGVHLDSQTTAMTS